MQDFIWIDIFPKLIKKDFRKAAQAAQTAQTIQAVQAAQAAQAAFGNLHSNNTFIGKSNMFRSSAPAFSPAAAAAASAAQAAQAAQCDPDRDRCLQGTHHGGAGHRTAGNRSRTLVPDGLEPGLPRREGEGVRRWQLEREGQECRGDRWRRRSLASGSSQCAGWGRTCGRDSGRSQA